MDFRKLLSKLILGEYFKESFFFFFLQSILNGTQTVILCRENCFIRAMMKF